jgi:hypothetical protein
MMKLRRIKTKEEKQMRRYRYFDDAVRITEKFKRHARTTYTVNYAPTFTSYDELESERVRYAAKEEVDTRIITATLNQLQDELNSQPKKEQSLTLLHMLIDLEKLCRAIRDYQHDPKNYSGFQPQYWHKEYDPEGFALLAEFAKHLLRACNKLVNFWFVSNQWLLELRLFLLGLVQPKLDESPPLPPPIFLRPQIQPNSPNFAA